MSSHREAPYGGPEEHGFSFRRPGVLILMNASMGVTARAPAYIDPGPRGLRLVNSRNHAEPDELQRATLESPRESAASVVTDWPDAWLIAAVREEPPDTAALDTLVARYWKTLFGRCQMLTLDAESARDLAQDAWLRVLRSRRNLEPNGNFLAYLLTIATNLWRDQRRSERRAGEMAAGRMSSLDGSISSGDGETMALTDVIPDPRTLPAEEQALLKMDIDRALGRLRPQLRDVLTARFLSGESAAEIAVRYGRTEQTVSGWVREAVREMKIHLGDSRRLDAQAEKR